RSGRPGLHRFPPCQTRFSHWQGSHSRETRTPSPSTPGGRHRGRDGLVGMLSEGWPERREKRKPDLGRVHAEYSRHLFPNQEGNAEDRQKRTMSVWERQEIQEVLWRMS